MANPGVGNKFVPVNLNKSYGKQQFYQNHHSNQHQSSSYGSNRNRPFGGGGGMVVLSRPRSSQKASGPKLSVPPPLNLPSLRKEHEKFDMVGSGGGAAGGGLGGGPRPSSSGVGWTKLAAVVIQEKEVSDDQSVHNSSNSQVANQGLVDIVNGISKGSDSSLYTPPSARTVIPAVSVPSRGHPVVEKAVVFRGEDFPSLKASLPANSGPEKKQKDGMNQKQKQFVSEELSNDRGNAPHLSTLVDMRPQLQSMNNIGNGLRESGAESRGTFKSEKHRKQEDLFPGPLPLVRLNPRSDWADDERDTGLSLTERGRENGFSKHETFFDMDFDFPRPSILPQKPVHYLFDRRGQRDNEAGNISSSEVAKLENYGRDIKIHTREGVDGNSWRVSSPLSSDRYGVQDSRNEKNGIGMRPSSLNREAIKENKYMPSPSRDNSQDGGHAPGRQPWNNKLDSFGNRGSEWNNREQFGNGQYNKYRGNAQQSSSLTKSSFSLGSRGPPINDPILNFGRDRRSFSKSEKPYLEDPFMKEYGSAPFDGRDPLFGPLVGILKKKKEVLKQTDFHDPVRESFEAELEEVQKLQEQGRQRMNEEQARAMEMAQREEEERVRLAREQEEQQKRLEEERLEMMRRAEQERLESMHRAEEQRIAREEEKCRMHMEEERRKQAAKQKLLELEERIARRNAEGERSGNTSSSGVTDEKISGMVSEKNVPKVVDVGDWEDGERMVERITTSASSDSSCMNRPFEMGSRPQFHRDGSPAFLDREKAVNSWKRNVFERNSSTFFLHDQENGHRSPIQDSSVAGRVHSRKEFYGGPGFVPSRIYHTGGIHDSHLDDLGQRKGQSWNMSVDEDPYVRRMEIDSEFHENLSERFGDVEWLPNHSRGNPYPPNHDRMYRNPEVDSLYSFGRSRYSMKQPRVLPPPVNSMLRNPYRDNSDGPGPSTFPERDMHYNLGPRNESTTHARYDSSQQENVGFVERTDVRQEHTENVAYKMGRNSTCDSQSSLSVSSPPDSPVHLSHDDLDESADSPALSGNEGKNLALLAKGDEDAALSIGTEKENLMSASSVVFTADDEDWTIENDQQLQEQEEYDEDADGYEEEDEAHDVENDSANLAQDFEETHVEAIVSSDKIENLVLGFNEGVEVGMPNDEFERSSRNEETKFVAHQISVEEQESFEGMDGDVQAHQAMDSTKSVGNSCRIFQENEKALQDLVIQQKNVPQTSSASEFTVDASNTSGLTAQLQVSSSSGQTVMSGVPSVLGQPEVPVKLQFGLFSGPSLIPSPVPAIQIGSIQMPLHLHTPVGPSLTHLRPSQPPPFQFGQLRYTSPLPQGILPLAPQSMSFMQPSVPNKFPSNQNGGSLPVQPGQDNASHNVIGSDVLSASVDNKPGVVPRNLDVSHGQASKEQNSLPPIRNENINVMTQHQGEISHTGDCNSMPESGVRAGYSLGRNFRDSTKQCESQPHNGGVSHQYSSKEKDTAASKGRGIMSGGRGKRYSFAIKNSGSKSSLQANENSRRDYSGFQRPRRQRTEFRVRDSSDKMQSATIVSSSPHGMDDRSDNSGRVTGAKSTSARVVVPNRPSKHTIDSEGLNSLAIGSRDVDSGSKFEKGGVKESLRKNQSIAHSVEDVDAPLQSGVVRVFEQPGIEAPTDDDDFIEVRSKRQMLNDRREQKEKEIKAKSRVVKLPRKLRSSSQSNVAFVTSNKIPLSVGAEASNSVHPERVGSGGHGLANVEVSGGFNSPVMSQPLPPIGTPAVKTDAQADIRSQTIKSLQPSSLPAASGGGKNYATGLMFDSKHKILDNAQASLGVWSNSRINQQVMALTQSQLDEAMNPAQFDSNASVGDPSKSVGDSNLPSSSILVKEKSFSSTASPINSLLAGEKIQFGAVTSPTILPPSSREISHGIGPLGPCRADVQTSHNLTAAENDCSLFFEKEDRSNEPCANLVDCEAEAEAEAAASAIAVAAISSDEIVDHRLSAGPVPVSDSKKFSGADIEGVSRVQQLSSQSRAEESLSVALPADLSVETTPISLWPPVPSPHNSSSQMLSHVPGGPPSHFPFYEMNPMLGGPIFAFGPHDESASPQSQPQKSNASVSGPLGTWQHHSGVDSFYGPPAGFTGPFISPPGSIPGVQGPPHMVVYNHFAPVGQVGLSFMGTTYLPSGKQPDWKHNPASSVIGVGEGDMNSLNMVSAQRSPANMPASIQHLAPGSPLMPMGSPLAMFDVSPFQSSPDMSVQARWSHITSSPLQSAVPVSMPLQPQAEGTLSSQFNRGASVDHQLANRYSDSRTATSSDKKNQNFPAGPDATTVLPDELGLGDPSSSTGGATSTQNVIARSSSASTIPDFLQNGNGSNNGRNSGSFKTQQQPSHQKSASAQHYSNSSGEYSYQRGGHVSQKNTSSGGEWSHHHRRMGYQGRNQTLGAEKSFPPSKLKQIYVAKQTSTGGASSTT